MVRALALLDLPPEVQDRVDGGKLPASVAYEVSRLDDPEQQIAPAEAVTEHGLNRSEVALAVKANRPTPIRRPDPVEVDLGDGVKVRVTWSRRSTITALQAPRKAVQEIQDRQRKSGATEAD